VLCSVVHHAIIISKRHMPIVHSIDNDYFSDRDLWVHRVSISFFIVFIEIQQNKLRSISTCFNGHIVYSMYTNRSHVLFDVDLALPEVHRVQHRDVSYSRRPAHDVEVNPWREPDCKPTFSFNLRPRIIQEGIGCKLICCVNGKPQPKVNKTSHRFVSY
jgi:hypothetical protein